MMNLDKTAKAKAFEFVYSNPVLRYTQNWGHIVTRQFLPEQGLIMDLGAGTGEHQQFAKPACQYTALDMDQDVLRLGRDQGRNQRCVQATAQHLPFKNGSLDGVVSVYSLEHLSNLENCVAEIIWVLKPGGILAVAIPTEGAMFRLGRRLVTAPFAVKNLGFSSVQDYENYIATQHINSVDKILSALKKNFQLVKKRWFPFLIGGPNVNLNLSIKAVRKQKI